MFQPLAYFAALGDVVLLSSRIAREIAQAEGLDLEAETAVAGRAFDRAIAAGCLAVAAQRRAPPGDSAAPVAATRDGLHRALPADQADKLAGVVRVLDAVSPTLRALEVAARAAPALRVMDILAAA